MSHKERLPDLVHKGITFQVETMRDDDHEPPWEDGDGRGVVIDWQGHRTLDPIDQDGHQLRRLGQHGSARYFDVTATRAKALEEDWGVKLPHGYASADSVLTADQRADIATEQEYEFLNGWCSDEWEYIGVIVTLPGTGIEASLWGIESNAGDYLQEVARELADQIIGDPETQSRLRATEARTRELLGQVQDVLAEEAQHVQR